MRLLVLNPPGDPSLNARVVDHMDFIMGEQDKIQNKRRDTLICVIIITLNCTRNMVVTVISHLTFIINSIERLTSMIDS